MAVRTTDLIWEDVVDPTASDDGTTGIRLGDEWRNTVSGEVFDVTSIATGAAVWTTKGTNLSSGATVIADSAILTPSVLTANTNDYNPSGWIVSGKIMKTVLRLNTDGSNYRLTGIVPGSPDIGNVVRIINVSTTNNITIRNNDSASLANNRFLMAANAVLAPGEASTFYRDNISGRWRQTNDYK